MSIEAMKRIKSLLQDTKMIDSHTISAVVAECDMAILAQQPATGEPVAWMASYVDPVGNDHVYVTSHRDLAVENDMHREPKPLYTRPAPSEPGDVVRDAISTVREHYRGTDWGKAAESICDAIDAAMLAAPYQQQPATPEPVGQVFYAADDETGAGYHMKPYVHWFGKALAIKFPPIS